MPNPWYRSLPASGALLLLIVALWAWRSDTASGLERVWIGLMTVATGFGLWGLARALQTRGWVGDEQIRHPDLNYVSAVSVAQTHVVTHATTMITTFALLFFGVVVAFSAPVAPGAPPSRNSYVLTGTMLVIGVAKTFLNIYLVYKRDRLVRVVMEIGGD
jgi:hypothetical protein